jgi:hypothetical protein
MPIISYPDGDAPHSEERVASDVQHEKTFLITHKPQPVSGAGMAWAGYGRLPNKDAATWLRDRIAG